MAITEYTINASVGTTEYSITHNSTSIATQTGDGVMQAFIDFNAMTASEQYQVRVYEKTRSASTQRVVYEAVLTGAQDEIFVTPALTLMHGWDVTLDKLAGTDRTIEASVRLIPIA
jgi:hypothetical protein